MLKYLAAGTFKNIFPNLKRGDLCNTNIFFLPSQIIDHVTAAEEGDLLRRREGYWQHELMTLPPWGLNTRDELGGQGHGSTRKN